MDLALVEAVGEAPTQEDASPIVVPTPPRPPVVRDLGRRVSETSRLTDYGYRGCSGEYLTKLLKKKLLSDAREHTLSMQQRGGVQNSQYGDRLLQLGADHNVPIARAIKAPAGFGKRLLWVATSAQTKGVHTAVISQDGSYRYIIHIGLRTA